MAALAGDQPPGASGLPRPPVVAGKGLTATYNAWAQLTKMLTETLPNLSLRLASDVDRRRGTGTRIQ